MQNGHLVNRLLGGGGATGWRVGRREGGMERKWEMGGDVTVSPRSLHSTDTEQFGQSDWLGSGILSASDISRTEPLWSPFGCLH